MRVLIVDDNEVTLTVLHNALTQAGYEVESAKDGRAALAMLREGGCRLVISDWEMPHLSGVELCRIIRAEDFPGYVYIILLTGHDALTDKVEGLTAGADDFVTKPFHPTEL